MEQNSNIIEVPQADLIKAADMAEIDIQIATAKKYPRNINQALEKIVTYGAMDKETAMDCFYYLSRQGQDINGLSIRMAEIVASCWGNLRVATRIMSNDGKTITAQAMCHDLETNVAVCKEVKRSILTKDGRTFSMDMQVVTGNAASAIAFRNAVLAVVPKAITRSATERIKAIAEGKETDPKQLKEDTRVALAYWQGKGVTMQQVAYFLGLPDTTGITQEHLFKLHGCANAINEGTTTVKESFIDPYNYALAQQAAEAESKTNQSRAQAAMAQGKR